MHHRPFALRLPSLLLASLVLAAACGGGGGDGATFVPASAPASTASPTVSATSSTPASTSTPSSPAATPPVTPAMSFDVQAAGSQSLMPADPSTAQDPTNPANSPSGTTPYFVARTGITVDTLKALMVDATTFPVAESPVTVKVGPDSYTGFRLADVVVRATRFRPADYNTGAFGVTTAVIASGAGGDKAVFSFTELIRTTNGNATVVAYLKNGATLPDAEGRMAVLAANDTDPALRKVARLQTIGVRNEYAATSYTLSSSASAAALTPDAIAFQVSGRVKRPIAVTSPTLSTSSSQGYYAVTMVGDKDAASLPTYYFHTYGPRHTVYLWGQGVRLTDVLDAAGLELPAQKNRCFVVLTSANKQPALFSCGELYNSVVGTGGGSPGSANRSRHQGVLLVTDDLRAGSGNNMMMNCWVSLDNCTKTNGTDPTTYTSAMDANGDKVNYMSVALVSTEDAQPFIPFGRWYPMPATCASTVWQCNAWIDVGERLQQNIKSLAVYYAD